MAKIQHLEMRGISKSFHGIPANQDIDLTIASGEILGLLGENGAGKTTLMNILYGLYQPDSGDIIINEKAEREGMSPVIFPHWFHRVRFQCSVCHVDLGFKTKAGSNYITMLY
mgnify:CR=1 FL=1